MRALIGIAALLLSGCLTTIPRVKLAESTAARTATWVDLVDRTTGGALPAEVASALTDALAERSVEGRPVEAGSLPFATTRSTPLRLAQLAQRAEGAPLVLLTELRPQFVELLYGRFKWVVAVRLSVAEPGDLGAAQEASFEVPVFLQFGHQREEAALKEAAPTVAERAGRLMDQFLGGRERFPRAPVLEKQAAAMTAPTQVGPWQPRGVYFVMVDRFVDGTPDAPGTVDRKDPAAWHGGDIEGLTKSLGHIQSLGFDTVWLSPVFASRQEKFFGHGAFHGYWVERLDEVEPRFGDRGSLRRLSDALHARGMRLVLDLVLNHVAPDGQLAAERPTWFHHEGPIADWNSQTELETHDVMGLPDLAQERPEVAEWLLRTSLAWIDAARPDGFRLDAVKHVPLAFWSRFSKEVHAHAGPGFWLVGELLDGDAGKVEAMRSGGGFDAMFDFSTGFAVVDGMCRGRPERIGVAWKADAPAAPPAARVTLLDNHDLPRLASLCRDPMAADRAWALLMLSPGVPSLAWGSESRLDGAKEPESRADMRFPADTALVALFAKGMKERAAHPVLAQPERTAVLGWRDGLLNLCAADGRESVAIEVGADSLTHRYGPPERCPASQRREVRVRVSGAPAGELRLVGAGEALGRWQPTQAPTLVASLPDLSLHAFKLVRLAPGGAPEWEPGGDRTLFVPQGTAPLELALEWGKR